MKREQTVAWLQDLHTAGRLDSLFDTVRADTVGEVLDQALALVNAGHVVAAVVLTGGALETHLPHLCMRHNLTWSADGSIEKYNSAIAQARNAGTVEVYSANDAKLVTAWGGMRNDAAHKPSEFAGSKAEVQASITGVREFIARVP